jgi:very-short-patch-repair endonuclease
MCPDPASFAKALRKRSTEAENLLWRHIRAKRFQGLKFRRQEPIGRYIVDFVCYERRVIIELDGGQHSAEREKDEERDGWLGTQGFKVLRFWDNDVLKKTEEVLEAIIREC